MVTAVTLWRFMPRDSAKARGDAHSVRWLRESWPLFLNQLLQGLFFKIDALLLPGMAGTVAAGVYAAAYKVSEGAGIVSSSFTLALFPRLSRASDTTEAYRLGLRLLLQVALPLAAGTALLAEPIVALVGGREYLPDSAVALAILICYLPLSYANGLTQYVLIAAGRQRLLTAAFVAAVVFNFAANLVLIPRFSYVGAAVVTVVSELVLLVPFQRAASKVTPGVGLVREARIPLLGTLLMAPVVWWLRDALHPLAAVAAGSVVYVLALWSLGGIDARQRGLLRQLLRGTALVAVLLVGSQSVYLRQECLAPLNQAVGLVAANRPTAERGAFQGSLHFESQRVATGSNRSNLSLDLVVDRGVSVDCPG
jgi:O-antigen/teichoic acid export membrane protein